MDRIKQVFKSMNDWWSRFVLRENGDVLVPYIRSLIVEHQPRKAVTSEEEKMKDERDVVDITNRGVGTFDGKFTQQGEFRVGLIDANGPALQFQELAVLSAVSNINRNKDWMLTIRKESQQVDWATVVYYSNRVFVSKQPMKTWSIGTFRSASMLTRRAVETFLLCLRRVTKLDRHIVCGRILPFLEDYGELFNYTGRLELKVVPADPYPHMSLNLLSRQCRGIQEDDNGDCDEASTLARAAAAEAESTSNNHVSVMVLMSDPHAFTCTCRFSSTPPPQGLVLKQQLLWDK
jgi:hypothetical protein